MGKSLLIFAAQELSMSKIGKENTVYEVKGTPADSINKLNTLNRLL